MLKNHIYGWYCWHWLQCFEFLNLSMIVDTQQCHKVIKSLNQCHSTSMSLSMAMYFFWSRQVKSTHYSDQLWEMSPRRPFRQKFALHLDGKIWLVNVKELHTYNHRKFQEAIFTLYENSHNWNMISMFSLIFNEYLKRGAHKNLW